MPSSGLQGTHIPINKDNRLLKIQLGINFKDMAILLLYLKTTQYLFTAIGMKSPYQQSQGFTVDQTSPASPAALLSVLSSLRHRELFLVLIAAHFCLAQESILSFISY